MLVPNSLKAVPAENYDDLKRQFFALKKLCESKINECSVYSKKLSEYDREALMASSEALESEREMNAQLTTELEKVNERVKELEQAVLEEIENRDSREKWLDKLSSEIARYVNIDIGEHSSANNPWLEAFEVIPEGTLNKFAIEKKIKALDDLLEEIECSVVVPKRYEELRKPYLDGIRHCISLLSACRNKYARSKSDAY